MRKMVLYKERWLEEAILFKDVIYGRSSNSVSSCDLFGKTDILYAFDNDQILLSYKGICVLENRLYTFDRDSKFKSNRLLEIDLSTNEAVLYEHTFKNPMYLTIFQNKLFIFDNDSNTTSIFIKNGTIFDKIAEVSNIDRIKNFNVRLIFSHDNRISELISGEVKNLITDNLILDFDQRINYVSQYSSDGHLKRLANVGADQVDVSSLLNFPIEIFSLLDEVFIRSGNIIVNAKEANKKMELPNYTDTGGLTILDELICFIDNEGFLKTTNNFRNWDTLELGIPFKKIIKLSDRKILAVSRSESILINI